MRDRSTYTLDYCKAKDYQGEIRFRKQSSLSGGREMIMSGLIRIVCAFFKDRRDEPELGRVGLDIIARPKRAFVIGRVSLERVEFSIRAGL